MDTSRFISFEHAIYYATQVVYDHGLDVHPVDLLRVPLAAGHELDSILGIPHRFAVPCRIITRREPIPAALERDLLRLPCIYCGQPSQAVDHRLAVVKGGNSSPFNLAPACSLCNMSKRDKLWKPGCRMSQYLRLSMFH